MNKPILIAKRISQDGQHHSLAQGVDREIRLNGVLTNARALSLLWLNINPLAEKNCRNFSYFIEPAFVSIMPVKLDESGQFTWVEGDQLLLPAQPREIKASASYHKEGEILTFHLDGLSLLRRHWELQLLERINEPSAETSFCLSSVREVVDYKMYDLGLLSAIFDDVVQSAFSQPLYDAFGIQIKAIDSVVMVVARPDMSREEITRYVLTTSK